MSPIRTITVTMREHHFAAILTLAKNLRYDHLQEIADEHPQREQIREAVWILGHEISRANVAGA